MSTADRPLKIGYTLSLTGGLASNGRTARLAHQLWREDVNGRGGILGRSVELVCLDDETNPNTVAALYERLLDTEKVDLVIGGYGDNSVAPAMPLITERKKFFVGLMALAVNARFGYPQYFVMIPTGPNPSTALTEGFFDVLARQNPKPETVAILAADAPFSLSPVQGAKDNLTRNAMRVVSETRYPLATTDFSPYVDELKRTAPDVLFMCSYINDSAGLLKAIDKQGFEPKALGGAMIGPQNGIVKAELGRLPSQRRQGTLVRLLRRRPDLARESRRVPEPERRRQEIAVGMANLTYYAVELIPVEGHALSHDVIASHAEHLRELDRQGKLVLAGPFADDPRGLLVLNCDDHREAEAVLDVDPLIVGGIRTYRISTWLIADADNDYSP
jgi:uncharacterized protein YciI